MLGKINPDEQKKFEDGQSANAVLVKMLKKEIEKTKVGSVKSEYTVYAFKNMD